jgi:hypothetical protein
MFLKTSLACSFCGKNDSEVSKLVLRCVRGDGESHHE